MPALIYPIPSRHMTRWLNPPLTIIRCPHRGCLFEAVRESEGAAIRSICAHVVKAHHATEQETK